jgi:hypothetical protein
MRTCAAVEDAKWSSAKAQSASMPVTASESERRIQLQKACAIGDLDSVKRLVDEGACIHGRGCFSTPMYNALSSGAPRRSTSIVTTTAPPGPPRLKVARYLIERGADPNKASYADTHYRSPEEAAGARQQLPGPCGPGLRLLNLLMIFCEQGSIEVVKFLLAHGAGAAC